MLSSPYKNSHTVYSSIKQSLQRLGKDLVNGEYLVNVSGEILVPLYDLIPNLVPGITQADACMVTKQVHVPVQTKPVFPERTNMSGADSRKRKWNRFQVGTFMSLQKQIKAPMSNS